MNKKLYEIVSEQTGTKITLLDKELTLKRFSLGVIARLEKDNGEGLDQILSKLQDKPIEYGPKIAWELLIEKEEFNSSYDTFLDCLGIAEMQIIGDALSKVIMNSQPVGNAEGTKE